MQTKPNNSAPLFSQHILCRRWIKAVGVVSGNACLAHASAHAGLPAVWARLVRCIIFFVFKLGTILQFEKGWAILENPRESHPEATETPASAPSGGDVGGHTHAQSPRDTLKRSVRRYRDCNIVLYNNNIWPRKEPGRTNLLGSLHP